jgi:hypothetical protein
MSRECQKFFPSKSESGHYTEVLPIYVSLLLPYAHALRFYSDTRLYIIILPIYVSLLLPDAHALRLYSDTRLYIIIDI